MIKYIGIHRKALDLNAIVREKYEFIDIKVEIPTELDIEQKVFRNFSTINALDDKEAFKDFCLKNGLPTLPHFTKELTESGHYVIKPKIGSGSVGLKYVKLIDGQRYRIPETHIAEHRASGPTYGAGVIVREGYITSMASWQRLRTFPTSGGPSVLSKRIHSKAISQLVEDFMENLAADKPSGCFMLEFIEDNDDIYFLEINPRIWGSVALMECGGFNFTQDLIAALFDKKIIIKADTKLRNIEYFCNPILYPWYSLTKSQNTFYSGFTCRSFLEGIKYLVRLLKLENILKIVRKLI
jgi:predicted ATP-grasp superfamily ATP-dependent carboligase